jgi:Flp pilus assembly pilin Flp
MGMRLPRFRDDQGTGLVEYALVALLVAIGSLVAVSFVGDATSQQFDEAATALSADPDGVDEELTPEEKWDKALADFDQAIADAKADKAAAVAKANAEYQAAVDANQSLPKADRKTANQEAKAASNAAKSAADDAHKGAVQAAKDARAAAKAEYNATK